MLTILMTNPMKSNRATTAKVKELKEVNPKSMANLRVKRIAGVSTVLSLLSTHRSMVSR